MVKTLFFQLQQYMAERAEFCSTVEDQSVILVQETFPQQEGLGTVQEEAQVELYTWGTVQYWFILEDVVRMESST